MTHVDTASPRSGVQWPTCSAVNVQLSPAACFCFDQSGHSFRKPLPQTERVKVSDRKPDMLDVTTLLAAVYDWADVKVEVGHVRVFL